MSWFIKTIEKHWYHKKNIGLFSIFLPLGIVFALITELRYWLYRLNILKKYKLPIPVVVIGNISVGGVGKTPLTKHIANELQFKNIKVGIILRGYKGSAKQPMIVTSQSDSHITGDEAIIYAQNKIPVAIGVNRYAAGKLLLEHYPNLDIILADDGMQHYKLYHDYVVAVVDATRMFGNKRLLPQGPLREPIKRLKQVNAVVMNGSTTKSSHLPCRLIINQTVTLDKIYNPITQEILDTNHLTHKNLLAIAAMGNPQRFFDLLEQNNIHPTKTMTFPDHYHYVANDIEDGFDYILVTEKDYTKLAKFNNAKIWVVLIKVSLNNDRLLKEIMNLVHKHKYNNRFRLGKNTYVRQ